VQPVLGPPCLLVEELSLPADDPFGTTLRAISLQLHAGEILGIAGIAGNGQNELMDALSGEIPAGKPETIRLDGVAVGHMGPRERRAIGGCFVPEERNGHGAVGPMTLSDNAFLTAVARKPLSNSPARSSRASTCAPPAPGRRLARCRAAICRSSWSAARSCRPPRRS
jgi:simple sugar transport system ATP-binding protein